jgi:hypothetical protein
MNAGVLRARWLLSAQLLAAAALFAIGVAAERNKENHHDEPTAAVESVEGDHEESAEAAEQAEAGEEGEHAEEATAGNDESDEKEPESRRPRPGVARSR